MNHKLLFLMLAASTAAGCASLETAAYRGDTEKVRSMLARGADPNKPDAGILPLNAAILGPADKCVGTVKALIERGANVNQVDYLGAVPLYYALTGACPLQGAIELLKAGADPNHPLCEDAPCRPTGPPPLQWGLRDNEDRLALTKVFLDKGASIDARDPHDGRTALLIAAEFGMPKTVALLLSRGAQPKAVDNAGNTAADWAVTQNHVELAKALLDAGSGLSDKVAKQLRSNPNLAGAQVINDYLDRRALDKVEADEKKGDRAAVTGQPDAALAAYADAYLETPEGAEPEKRLRSKLSKLFAAAAGRPPTDESEHFSGRGEYAAKGAKSTADYAASADEFRKAVALAPWLPQYRFNLALVLEKEGELHSAKREFELYLLAYPEASDAAAVKKRIAGLEYAMEKSNP